MIALYTGIPNAPGEQTFVVGVELLNNWREQFNASFPAVYPTVCLVVPRFTRFTASSSIPVAPSCAEHGYIM